MFCPNCGGLNQPADQFCRTCGYPLTAEYSPLAARYASPAGIYPPRSCGVPSSYFPGSETAYAPPPAPAAYPPAGETRFPPWDPVPAPAAPPQAPAAPVSTYSPPAAAVREAPAAPSGESYPGLADAAAELFPSGLPPLGTAAPAAEEDEDAPWRDDAPVVSARRSKIHWGRGIGAFFLFILLFFSAVLAAAALGLSTLDALESLHPENIFFSPEQLPLLHGLQVLCSQGGAVGLCLLSGGLFLALFRCVRPLAAWRCCACSLALAGVPLLLCGLNFAAFLELLPAPWHELLLPLAQSSALSWRIFISGVILLSLWIFLLLCSLPLRSRGGPRDRGLLAFLSLVVLALLLCAAVLLTRQYTSAALTQESAAPAPPTQEDILEQARAAVNCEDYDLALSLLAPLNPTHDSRIPLLLAQCQFSQGDLESAAATLERAIVRFPDEALPALLGKVLLEQGNQAAGDVSDPQQARLALEYYKEAQIYLPDHAALKLAINALNDKLEAWESTEAPELPQ